MVVWQSLAADKHLGQGMWGINAGDRVKQEFLPREKWSAHKGPALQKEKKKPALHCS